MITLHMACLMLFNAMGNVPATVQQHNQDSNILYIAAPKCEEEIKKEIESQKKK